MNNQNLAAQDANSVGKFIASLTAQKRHEMLQHFAPAAILNWVNSKNGSRKVKLLPDGHAEVKLVGRKWHVSVRWKAQLFSLGSFYDYHGACKVADAKINALAVEEFERSQRLAVVKAAGDI